MDTESALDPAGFSGMTRRVGAYLARNHIALLALFLALGGTSYAVSRNSVGTARSRTTRSAAS
ncbi:MAG: hypothetical protein ACREX8_02220, partial [Gammaproteobacteria bacterium]